MKVWHKLALALGVSTLAALPESTLASKTTSISPKAGVTVKDKLAYGRCVRWEHRCYRTRKCSKYRTVGRCYHCYKRWRNYYGRNFYRAYRTCNYGRVKSLRYYGYRCKRAGYARYYGPACVRWYYKTYCKRYCTGRAFY